MGGSYTVQWNDQAPGDIDPGLLSSLTWYYASRLDASDRKRITTQFREDFVAGFMRNWRAEGASAEGWAVRRDGRSYYLAGPSDASPAVTVDPTESNVVISALVRPRSLQTGFTLGLRVQPNSGGYELRTTAGGLTITEGGRTVVEQRAPGLTAGAWYWYEVGLQSRKGREVVLRVRVFDEKRQRLLVDLVEYDRPGNGALLGPGRVSLSGPADFAELYVDPWEARWVDDCKNQFKWDTSVIPDGDYYLVAEVVDGKNPPRLVVSGYQVQVRNGRTGAFN